MVTVFFYLHRISRKENSDCSACGHPLQDLNHLLDCPASEPLRKSIFGSSILDLWSRPRGVARLLGLRGVPPRPHPSEGSGSTTTMLGAGSFMRKNQTLGACPTAPKQSALSWVSDVFRQGGPSRVERLFLSPYGKQASFGNRTKSQQPFDRKLDKPSYRRRDAKSNLKQFFR